MSDPASDVQPTGARGPTPPTENDPGWPPLFETIVVRYEDGPNRYTIVPPACADEERVTHWITADADAFVALDDRR